MPRDSNGNASTDPVYVATPGTTIRAVQHNTPIADIIQMLTGSLARNGTGGMRADLAMGGFKITGLADGTSAQDAVTKAQLDATLGGLPQLGAWTNVASASTVDLGAQTSRNIVITGNTTITSFGTAGAADNVPYLLRFSGALTLTNGANLILPGGANIVTAVGDIAIVIHDDADTWRIAFYSRAAMLPLIAGTSANNLVALDANGKLPAVDGSQLLGLGAVTAKATQRFTVSGNYTPTPGTKFIMVVAKGGSGGGNGGRTGAPGPTAISFAGVDDTQSYPVVIGAGGGGTSGQTAGDGGASHVTIQGIQYGAPGGAGAKYDNGQYWPGRPLKPLPAAILTLTLQREEREGVTSSYQEAILGTYYSVAGAVSANGNPGVLAILEFGA